MGVLGSRLLSAALGWSDTSFPDDSASDDADEDAHSFQDMLVDQYRGSKSTSGDSSDDSSGDSSNDSSDDSSNDSSNDSDNGFGRASSEEACQDPMVLISGTHYDHVTVPVPTKKPSGATPTMFGQVAITEKFRISRAEMNAIRMWVRGNYFQPSDVRGAQQAKKWVNTFLPMLHLYTKAVPAAAAFLKRIKERGYSRPTLLLTFAYFSLLELLLREARLPGKVLCILWRRAGLFCGSWRACDFGLV